MLQWKIGSVTITSVSESESITSPRFLFKDLNKAAVLEAAAAHTWLRPNFVDDDGYLLQKIQALVIDTGSTVIVVDTCIGNDKVRANPGWNGLQLPFLDDLAAAGYTPEAVDVVVCTHLHVDHVGWNTRLVDGRWVPTFPNARYLFARPEFEHWRDTGRDGDAGDDVFGDSVQPIVDAGLADLVPVDHQICGEVRLEPTHGHTPGHVSVVIGSGGEQAVITGDMIHTPLQIALPELSSSFDTDPDAARVTRRDFLGRYADGRTLVIGTHFGTPTAGKVSSAGPDSWRLDC
jgi:glyoxylase-like metal-dependent hydrolase (beta-lactamase superfamily II)